MPSPVPSPVPCVWTSSTEDDATPCLPCHVVRLHREKVSLILIAEAAPRLHHSCIVTAFLALDCEYRDLCGPLHAITALSSCPKMLTSALSAALLQLWRPTIPISLKNKLLSTCSGSPLTCAAIVQRWWALSYWSLVWPSHYWMSSSQWRMKSLALITLWWCHYVAARNHVQLLRELEHNWVILTPCSVQMKPLDFLLQTQVAYVVMIPKTLNHLWCKLMTSSATFKSTSVEILRILEQIVIIIFDSISVLSHVGEITAFGLEILIVSDFLEIYVKGLFPSSAYLFTDFSCWKLCTHRLYHHVFCCTLH